MQAAKVVFFAKPSKMCTFAAMQQFTFPDIPNVNSLAVTTGIFDGVHCGHRAVINTLLNVAKNSHLLSCVVTYEPHPRTVLDGTPIPQLCSMREKQQLLNAIGLDYMFVIPFTSDLANTSLDVFFRCYLLDVLRTKELVVGFDHNMGKNYGTSFAQIEQIAASCNVGFTRVERCSIGSEKISSSAIRRALLDGNIMAANAMLGYSYSLTGTVVRGAQIGRSIAFPTANIALDCAQKLVPKAGAYVVQVFVNGRTYGGMFNISAPFTINHSNAPTLEVNIFDFDDDIYDHTITISFLARLRDELKFESLNALKAQLARDAEQSQRVIRNL